MSDKVADPTREVVMGSEARDKISGLEGIINADLLTLNGVFQWALQPRGDGKDIPEGWNVDPVQLEWIGEGLEASVPEPDHCEVELGDEAEDIVTGFRGIATQRSIQLNGCVLFKIEGKLGSKQGEEGGQIRAPNMMLLSGRLKKVEAAARTATPRKKTGGPSNRVERMS